MNVLDYGIIVLFLAGMIAIGRYFKKSEEASDYFLGGKKFGWFALAMSVMASQLSAISFISAPAFVGMRKGGGMQWLTFEFGVPIAILIIIIVIAPNLYKSGAVTAYAFLEKRFGVSSRLLISSVYLISRGFATGIVIYTVCLFLSIITGISFLYTMLIIALITILYSFEGGMKAVVYSEVAQMIIIILGILIIAGFGLYHLGGWGSFVKNLDRDRLQVIDFSKTGLHGDDFGFWPMLVGGVFLYTAYYGTDQTQAQRILSAKDYKTARQLMLANGLFRFPITLSYCMGGLIVGTFVIQTPELLSKIPADKPDMMLPVYILDYLPNGIIGFIVVALMAAGMSSYSSALNSLSAVTMEDLVMKKWTHLKSDKYVKVSKLIALGWGILTMILAFYVDDIAKTVIEAINKISSMFNGPVLSTFLIAMLTKKITAKAVNIGLVAGVLFNLFLWIRFPQVFWFWWNAIGAIVTLSVTIIIALLFPNKKKFSDTVTHFNYKFWDKETFILIVFLLAMITFCFYLPEII